MNKPLKISEAGTVQFPMVRHAAEIGWTTITPDDARAKRGGDAGTFLRDVLEAKLAAFNPWLTADAVRAIVETLDALPASIEGNRELLSWLRGERAWYDEAEKRHRAVNAAACDILEHNATTLITGSNPCCATSIMLIGLRALCIPTETSQGYSAAKIANAAQPKIP